MMKNETSKEVQDSAEAGFKSQENPIKAPVRSF